LSLEVSLDFPKEKSLVEKKYFSERKLPRLYPVTIVGLLILTTVIIFRLDFIVLVIIIILNLFLLIGVIWQEISLKLDRLEYPDCAVCGSESYVLLFEKDGLNMVRCGNCSQVYARPRFGNFRRKVFTQYHSFLDVFDSRRRMMLQSEDNRTENFIPKLEILNKYGYPQNGEYLLDAGCGIGAFLKSANEQGFKCTGIEPGISSGFFGKLRLGFDINITTIENFKNLRKFDIITCLHVIEHVVDPLKFFKKMMDVCKPMGIVLIATPNIGCEKAISLREQWEAAGPADHLFLFEKRTIQNLAERAGFQVIDIVESGKEFEELILVCQPAVKTI